METDAGLEAWIIAVSPGAIAYARSLTGHADDAEDLVHDVICRLISHREYNLPRDGERLLFRSITNACINRRMRAREVESLDAERGEGLRLLDTVASDDEADPADVAMTHELSAAIERELRELPQLQRAAVELKSTGKPLKEIAEVLGLTPVNAGVLICRGRKQLARRLAPYLPENAR